MKFPLISAGEFFELLRPAADVLSAVISSCVLASARRRSFRLYAALAWALGTFLLPFVILPLYLLLLIFHKPWLRRRSHSADTDTESSATAAPPIRYRRLLPVAYALVLLSIVGLYFYRDYNSVDAHLARANQAKLGSNAAKTIREYRAALALEDNPHTHKLLGIELADAGQWAEALAEFRLAQRGNEPDDLLFYRLGSAAEQLGDLAAATLEYNRFLDSAVCRPPLPDERCERLRKRLGSPVTAAARR